MQTMADEANTEATAPARRILFVDDEPLVLRSIGRMLARRVGWSLDFASSVEEAWSKLDAQPYDALVTDVNMPGRSGFDLLGDVRRDERFATMPVVVLTGAGNVDFKRRALDLGASDLLDKPVDREDLMARLRNAIRLKDQQDELRRQRAQLEDLVRARTLALERARIELVWRLGVAGEYRDNETGYHVVRVGYFARHLARVLGMDPSFSDTLFLTAPLHDIGKIGIPDGILLKPGTLNPTEWEVMRRHTEIGAQILRARFEHPVNLEGVADAEALAGDIKNPFVDMAAAVALAHHERWDGNGYPYKLKGEAIPVEARITAVADVFDALSSERPYKEAFPEEKVLAIMARGAGTHFDPEIYEAFLRTLDDFREIREAFVDVPLPDGSVAYEAISATMMRTDAVLGED